MENAKRDENFVPTLIGVSSDDGTTPIRVYVDPVTHRLLVDIPSAGTGTVTDVSVVSANGLAGTVATSTTTPAITLSTTVTGILEGNGTAISAATTTGTGSVVLATSPTLVTPNLGTPTSLTLTNATGLPVAGLEPLTPSEIVITTAGGVLASAATATYPSLTELTFLKGANSNIQTQIDALTGAVVLKGTWDASAGTFPGAGVAQAGWSYIVSVGGTVDGIDFVANDRIVALTDNASTTIYAGNWHKLDYTDAVLSVFGRTGAVSALDGDYSQSLITGLKTTDSPQFAGVNVGNASDTTIARVSAGVISVEGVTIPTISSTDTLTNKTLTAPSISDPTMTTELDMGAHSIGFTMQTATGDGTTTVTWGNGNHFDFTFGAFNETFTFTAPSKPGVYTMSLKQDSVGSRTATWPASVKWVGGAAPTLTTTATTGYDIISFRYDGTDYYGVASLNFS